MAGFAGLRNATITKYFALAAAAEEGNRDIFQHPVIQEIIGRNQRYRLAMKMANATASRSSLIGLKSLVLAATGEGSDAAPSTISVTNRDLATARNNLIFSLGDDEISRIPEMAGLASVASMSLERNPTPSEMAAMQILGEAAYWATINRMMALIRALATGWGTDYCTTGTDMSDDKLQAGRDGIVDAGGRGRLLVMDTRPSLNHWRADIKTMLGAITLHQIGQKAVDTGATVVINDVADGVDWAVDPNMPVVVGDTDGQMIAAGAVELKVETPKIQEGAQLIGVIGDPSAPLATIERRRAAGSTTILSVVSWLAAGVLDANLGKRGRHAT